MSTSTKTFTISTGISGADAICEVPPNPSSTLLLLVGWFGSKPKHVKKFQSLHRKMDGNIPTVSLTLPRSSVFGSFTTSSAAVQEEQLRVLNSLSSQILSPSTDNPFGAVTSVKWHVFSNGGCFLIRHLYSDEERLPSYPSIVKMKQITHSVIYDSAPCYPYMHLAARALTMGSGLSKTPNSLIENFLILPVVAVTFFLKAGVELLLGGKESPEGSESFEFFWKDFEVGTINSSTQELFLYSDNDALCPTEELEALIELRRCKKTKFVGSEHVMHFKMFGEDYERSIREFYEGVNSGLENNNNVKSKL